MNLWIISQDKEYLVENPIIDIDIKKNEVYILDRTYAKEPFIGIILGVYKSKERALEVLDEIQKLLIALPRTEIPFNDVVYQMPEE